MVRIPVGRPLLGALLVTVFGAALLVGATPAPQTSATAQPGSRVEADASPRRAPTNRDSTLREVVGDDRTRDDGRVPVVEVVAEPVVGLEVEPAVPVSVARDQLAGPAGVTNVPEVLWEAYRSAVASAPSSCHLTVQLLAAIGQVESGSLVGRGLDAGHRAVPAVLGPVLDGGAYAAIRDTDDGEYDGNATWDRAVGPMQFIPSTWRRWGRDGNDDGVPDPQNVEDSAHSAAAYLCAGVETWPRAPVSGQRSCRTTTRPRTWPMSFASWRPCHRGEPSPGRW